MTIDRGMPKEDVVYVYNSEVMPSAVTWMDLEFITPSEVSQRKTNISLICRI